MPAADYSLSYVCLFKVKMEHVVSGYFLLGLNFIFAICYIHNIFGEEKIEAYLEGLDELVRANMYPSRSSVIRSAVRDLLRKELWEKRGR